MCQSPSPHTGGVETDHLSTAGESLIRTLRPQPDGPPVLRVAEQSQPDRQRVAQGLDLLVPIPARDILAPAARRGSSAPSSARRPSTVLTKCRVEVAGAVVGDAGQLHQGENGVAGLAAWSEGACRAGPSSSARRSPCERPCWPVRIAAPVRPAGPGTRGRMPRAAADSAPSGEHRPSGSLISGAVRSRLAAHRHISASSWASGLGRPAFLAGLVPLAGSRKGASRR